MRVLAGGRPPLRLVAVAALLAGTVGAGLLVAGQRQQLPPAQHFADFAVPFDFRPVEGVPTDAPIFGSSLLAFTVGGPGPQTMPGRGRPGSDMFPLSESGHILPGAHGITIGSLQRPIVHTCPVDGHRRIRRDPAGFLDDLRAIAGAGLDDPRDVTFDGRPALEANVDPAKNGCDSVDYHVAGGNVGTKDDAMLLEPSRLIVTDVGGRTIVLQVWAATPEDLKAWLPTATRFLDGIHFTGDTSP